VDLVPFLLVEDGSVRDVVLGISISGIFVYDAKFGHAAHDNGLGNTFFAHSLDGTELLELEAALILGIDGRIDYRTAGGTTDVEGTERKLGTRLTEGPS
jgi:hypothetical protein